MIWQFIMFGIIIFGAVATYGKMTDGDTQDAAMFSMGTATLVGILMILTGFATVGDRNTPEEDANPPVTAHKPAIVEKVRPAPVRAPVQNAPAPQVQQFSQSANPVPAAPQINLGAAGAAYDRVEAIMMRYKQMYQQGVNDIQRTDMRFARGRELCQSQASQYAVMARLGRVSTDKNGNATVSFNTDSGMELVSGQTFERGSPVHTALAPVSPGSPVAVLFSFQPDETGKDCFHSHRWTERNNMTDPQWDVNILSVSVQQ